MKKNALIVLAILFGAAGLAFGYLALTQQKSINPLILLTQTLIPGDEAAEPGDVIQIVFLKTENQRTKKTYSLSDLNSTVHTLNISVQQGADLRVEFTSRGAFMDEDVDAKFKISLVMENNSWSRTIAYDSYWCQTVDTFDVNLLGFVTNLDACEYKIFLRIQNSTGVVGVKVGQVTDTDNCTSVLAATEYAAGTCMGL